MSNEAVDLRKQAEMAFDATKFYGWPAGSITRLPSISGWIHPVCALRYKPPNAERPPQLAASRFTWRAFRFGLSAGGRGSATYSERSVPADRSVNSPPAHKVGGFFMTTRPGR
jgi:hypothetical protein